MAGASTFCPCGSIVQLESFSSARPSSVRRSDVALVAHRIFCTPACKTQPLEALSLCGRNPVPQRSLAMQRSIGVLPKRISHGRAPCSALADTAGTVVKETASAEILRIWRSAEAVCFDVDSTVCVDEGIDELAAFCGAGEAVAEWTRKAMGGGVPFEQALAARLSIIKPSMKDVATYLAAHPPRLSPGIADLVGTLQQRGVAVYLVSGGFRQMIEPVAELLNIPTDQIYANRLLFTEDGEHAGFDPAEYTARSGGKAKAVDEIKKRNGFSTVVAIGDGATDLEARRPGGADAFIGYGGIVVRPTVAAAADWFVRDFQTLVQALGEQR